MDKIGQYQYRAYRRYRASYLIASGCPIDSASIYGTVDIGGNNDTAMLRISSEGKLDDMPAYAVVPDQAA